MHTTAEARTRPLQPCVAVVFWRSQMLLCAAWCALLHLACCVMFGWLTRCINRKGAAHLYVAVAEHHSAEVSTEQAACACKHMMLCLHCRATTAVPAPSLPNPSPQSAGRSLPRANASERSCAKRYGTCSVSVCLLPHPAEASQHVPACTVHSISGCMLVPW